MPRYPLWTALILSASCSGELQSPPSEPAQAEESPLGVAAVDLADANRLLDQMTFGARPVSRDGTVPTDSIQHVQDIGVTRAIIEQLDTQAKLFEPTPEFIGNCADAEFPARLDLGAQFMADALTAPDQLRLKVTFALSQILVVSENGIRELRSTCRSEQRDAMVRYLNALRSGAFSNYRNLLETITLEPAMGTFLDMANNRGAPGMTPNENFARELLQLFTIGTYLLDDGGQRVLVNGKPVPAYTESEVRAFANTLTGWTYGAPQGSAGCDADGKWPLNYTKPMVACEDFHNKTSQQLLKYAGATNDGKTSSDGTAAKHLDEALENLFQHPNLPPFICKQLIQHLVTSNPSPEYVARVVAVFKRDSNGRRGNLRAVVRAILSDSEARAKVAPEDMSYGRLRAPVEMIARMLRGLAAKLDTSGATVPGGFLRGRAASLGQDVPSPPSVFSYYPPDHPVPGTALVGPEFGLLDTHTITARSEVIHVLGSSVATNRGIDLAEGLALMPEPTAQMIDWLATQFFPGGMSEALRVVLTQSLDDPRAGNRRKQLALFLTFLSPQFQIQR